MVAFGCPINAKLQLGHLMIVSVILFLVIFCEVKIIFIAYSYMIRGFVIALLCSQMLDGLIIETKRQMV